LRFGWHRHRSLGQRNIGARPLEPRSELRRFGGAENRARRFPIRTHGPCDADGGSGDLGLPYWLDQVALGPTGPSAERALEALGRLAAKGKIDRKARTQLRTKLDATAPRDAWRYALGGILLSASAAEPAEQSLELAEKLTSDLAENESRLDAKSSGATVGAAMINFYKGEAQRSLGQFAEALASYETVLSVYPYNQWPDAAACGAAECYAAMGETSTALTKFREVAEQSATKDESVRWKELAKRRILELQAR